MWVLYSGLFCLGRLQTYPWTMGVQEINVADNSIWDVM